VHFRILLGLETGKRGRPRGFDHQKYYRVLECLRHGRLFFNEVVARSGVSRRFVAKVLKDALLRGVVSVDYEGHKAFYQLSELAKDTIAESNYLFSIWFDMGRPELGEFFAKLRETDGIPPPEIIHLEWACFLSENYPYHVIDASFLSGFDETGPIRFSRLFRECLTKPADPRWQIISEIVAALLQRRLCPSCFHGKELRPLEKENDSWKCYACKNVYKKPWHKSRIFNDFEIWRYNRLSSKKGLRIGRKLRITIL